MGCNCGKSSQPQPYSLKSAVPTITNGTNQVLIKQIQEQQRQQQAIQQIINPSKTLIKTYR